MLFIINEFIGGIGEFVFDIGGDIYSIFFVVVFYLGGCFDNV